jgi:hypothetical protein
MKGTGAFPEYPTTITALVPVSSILLLSGLRGEGYSALRDWRPIPAALLAPIRPTLFRGLKTFPFTYRAKLSLTKPLV